MIINRLKTNRYNFSSARLLVLCFSLLALGSGLFASSYFLTGAEASAQRKVKRTAIRTTLPNGKSKKKNSSVRNSPDAQVISQSQLNADGTIQAGQMLTFPVEQSTAEIMSD